MKKITSFLLLLFTSAGVTGAYAQNQSWLVDRSRWTVTAKNETALGLEGGASGPVAAMTDGNENSYWHSNWAGSRPGRELPQYFTVDLGQNMNLGGFCYLPRPLTPQGAIGDGTVSAYKVFVSNTPYNVTATDFSVPTSTPAMEGTFTYNTREWKYAQSTTAFSGRYILFVVTGSTSGSYATCAEFHLLGADAAGKSEEQVKLNMDATFAQTTIDNYTLQATLQAGMPGYVAADNEYVTNLNTAIGNAFNAADNNSNVTEAAAALNTAISNLNSAPAAITYPTDVYFTVTNTRGAISYDPERAGETDTQNGNAEYLQECTNPQSDNVNHLWSFIKNPQNNEYYLYNVGKKLFANSGGHGTYGDTWIFSKTPCPIEMEIVSAPGMHIKGNNKSMSVSTSYTGPIITYYASGDGGVPFTFSKSGKSIDASVTAEMEHLILEYNLGIPALETAISRATAYTGDNRIGTDLNQYSQPAGDDNLLTAVTEASAFRNAISASTTVAEVTNWTNKLNELVDHLTINQPESGKFYRIRCADTDMRRLLSDVDANNSRLKLSNTMESNSIFYFSRNQLLSYVKGQYVNEMIFANIGNEGTEVTFSDGAEIKIGTYTFKCGTRYLFGAGETLDSGTKTDMRKGYCWWLEPVNALPVSIGNTGFATLWAPVALDIPANVTAYTATLNKAENTLTLEEITDGVIPAETGVVLKADSGDFNFNIATTGNTVTSDLTGQVSTIAYNKDTDNKVYTLQPVEDGNVGFKAFRGTQLSGFKARLETTVAVQQVLGLIFGNTTGIDGVTGDENATGAVYDMSGRRVAVPAKGIYIVNGKKIIFK